MPQGDPFTALCQLVAATSRRVVADLHLHTTASDGDLTPSQLVHHARNAQLAAIAITDHDTLAGYLAARETLSTLVPAQPEIIPGVEVSAEHEGREVHILGYFVNPSDGALLATLDAICVARRERFRVFVETLAAGGTMLNGGLVEAVERTSVSLGRRHLAGLLVRGGFARTRFDAFRRFLQPLTSAAPPRHQIPVSQAISRIREAGGITVLAHPSDQCQETTFTHLAEAGLQGIEVKFPASNLSRTTELQRIAARLGLVCTGGSDLHTPADRAIGSVGLTRAEWEGVRSRQFGL